MIIQCKEMVWYNGQCGFTDSSFGLTGACVPFFVSIMFRSTLTKDTHDIDEYSNAM